MKKFGQALVLGAATALILTACTPGGNVAYQVGSQQVEVSTVEQAYQGCEQVLGGQGDPQLRSQVLNALIQGSLTAEVAANRGEPNTQEERDAVIELMPELQKMADDPHCRVVVEAQADINLALSKFGQDTVINDLADIEVELNPRYGRWDPAQLGAGGTGSLAIPGEFADQIP